MDRSRASEDFECLVDKPDALARFDTTLLDAGHEPHYIVFARRADTYVMSLYAELIHHGLTTSFRDFVREILRAGKVVTHGDWVFYFDMDAFARKWRQVVHGTLSIYGYDSTGEGAKVSRHLTPAAIRRIGRIRLEGRNSVSPTCFQPGSKVSMEFAGLPRWQ